MSRASSAPVQGACPPEGTLVRAEMAVDGPSVDGPVTLPDGASLAADLAIPVFFAGALVTMVAMDWLTGALLPAWGRVRAALVAGSRVRPSSSPRKPAALAAAK